ncbi:MAG: hypothetical protein IJ407_01690 [Clostridia bacterium]|nr:hypothetical protein [Clostridia bacterium]MBQ8600080.1 hypothetical protein [Clostridia bacterium]
MDILLQSDGQLYPPRHSERKREPPKPKPPERPPQPKLEKPPLLCPTPEPCASADPSISFEELLLIGVAFIVFRSSKEPDIPLLLALAYILFDHQFSLKGLF